uniref:Uncharacterized protein n=1 Tax=Rhizophora mucronata TaxID=61149 RepID=A0A2P2JF85_RHIMU
MWSCAAASFQNPSLQYKEANHPIDKLIPNYTAHEFDFLHAH